MNGKVILPPDYVDIDGPLIFLAGPIQGARDWQSEAIHILQQIAPQIHIACPRKAYINKEFVYEKQVDWETHHLRQAGRNGAILFWLAKEAEHYCKRAYAQTSRFELGEWKVKHERDGARLVVGIEDGFTNARYIRRRLSQDCPNVPICDSLEDTCHEAIQVASSK